MSTTNVTGSRSGPRARFPQSALKGLRRGIEKESLRVRPDGTLATSPHPARLGSALTHPNVTTDFSESQLELITGVHDSADGVPRGADRDSPGRSIARSATSCSGARACRAVCRRTTHIPIGRYGTSNVGRAKSIYRMGLSHRYGRRMQTISGIHYNFSLPGELSNAAYFALIRNFRRSFLAAALPVRRLARGVRELRRRPGARARALERGHVLPASRHLAAHGPAGLPERRAVARSP